MTHYRLFPSTNGPASPSAYTGNFLAGLTFQVTQWGMWFEGYWWWVPTGGDTGPQKFALWQISGTSSGINIPAATVTSGTLTAGQWNYIPLTNPIPLSADVPYLVETGWSVVHGFPSTSAQFGAAEPHAAGITNGPLMAYSDGGGSAPAPFGFAQGSFGTTGTDPAAALPLQGSSSSSNFWIDLQVSDTAPANYSGSYRLRPNTPFPMNMFSDSALPFTLATEFKLSQACNLNNIWFYSPSGATVLPSEIGIFNQSSQAFVSGTHVVTPTWSGAAGSGWVSASYSGVVLPSGSYRVAVFANTGTIWNNAVNNFWGGGGAGSSGITAGPLSAPSEATADTPGQASYHQGTSMVWPDTYNVPGNGSDYFVDVEVTPASDSATGSIARSPFAMASSANVVVPRVQANFDDAAINQVIDKIVSYALSSGRFDSVNGHEPKSAPGNGIVFAVWAQIIRPARLSGLAATSILVQFQGRIYIPFNQQPYDMIDPQVMAATTDMMAAFSADFDLGGAADVRYIDLLGIEGANMGAQGLSAQAGYVEIDRRMYRIMTLNIPIVINDAFKQVALWLSHRGWATTSTSGAST